MILYVFFNILKDNYQIYQHIVNSTCNLQTRYSNIYKNSKNNLAEDKTTSNFGSVRSSVVV